MNVSSSAAGKHRDSGRLVAPVVLAILDGWGYRDSDEHNAIRSAATPVMDSLWQTYPHTLIEASGSHVGLPEGQMGNSEVGHFTIGAGRVIRQELVRISDTVRMKRLDEIEALSGLLHRLCVSGKTLHLVGLVSDGGVHSHIDHLEGLIHWAFAAGVPQLAIHAITDGRDTPPQSGLRFLKRVQQALAGTTGELASLCGRYWAMDRDQRWERTSRAYDLYTNPDLPADSRDVATVIADSYASGINDEFLEPTRLTKSSFRDKDGILLFNFRPDRARQIIQALTLQKFEGFPRRHRLCLDVVTFTQIESGLPVQVAFPPESLDQFLGEVVSTNGLRQYRTAETEKYPHVTYFINGGIEHPLPGEDRYLVPSPRVATYDLSPAMAAEALTDSCINAIKRGIYALIVINYANPDMVGHTGIMRAATEAISVVDHCIGRLLDATGQMGGSILITADHGNAETMMGPDGQPWTAHTTNPVPAILVEGERRKLEGYGNAVRLRNGGGLADIAPTLLQLLSLPKPEVMTGDSLIEPMVQKSYMPSSLLTRAGLTEDSKV